MAGLLEIARFRTTLESAEIEHLQKLVAAWGMLADLCFADLLLWAPTDERADRYAVLDHIRPTTSQTIYRMDMTSEVADAGSRPLVGRCFESGEMVEGEIDHPMISERVRVLGIPIEFGERVIAVLTRETAPSFGRQLGELERTYLEIFDRFGRMIADGTFPYGSDEVPQLELAPRVGDGLLLLDSDGRVEFTSPNAVSALFRLGVHGKTEGMRMSELGLDERPLRRCFASRLPVTDELERGPDNTVLLRCLPLLAGGEVTGGVCLVRDISELRVRDRMLVSKDATIREIHHRVKNNLQTISSLLRLQGRRLAAPEAKAAVEESVRRIRSIALVHETLSREAGEEVPFIEIVRPLVRMVEEGYSSPDRPIRFKVQGDAGKLHATAATPLAVVLTELLQNVVDHAYPAPDEPAQVEAYVDLHNDGVELRVTVRDEGVGLPANFQLERSSGLGLQIVRTLVETELEGEISMSSGGSGEGTEVEIVVPLERAGLVPE